MGLPEVNDFHSGVFRLKEGSKTKFRTMLKSLVKVCDLGLYYQKKLGLYLIAPWHVFKFAQSGKI